MSAVPFIIPYCYVCDENTMKIRNEKTKSTHYRFTVGGGCCRRRHLLCAVLIMYPEDVMPSVVTVTAGWEKRCQVRSNWHAIDDPLSDVVVPNSFVSNFGRERWQLFA